MNPHDIWVAIQELPQSWSVGHSVVLLVGLLTALLVVLIGWLFFHRSVKSLRRTQGQLEEKVNTLQEGWDAETVRTAELTELVTTLRHKIKRFKEECAKSANTCAVQEKAKHEWRAHYELLRLLPNC